jgi:hypothetical protein
MDTSRRDLFMKRSTRERIVPIGSFNARHALRLVRPPPGQCSRNSSCSNSVINDGGSDLNNAVSNGNCGGMGPVERPELSSRGLDVLVDGTLGDMKNFADLPGGLASRHPCQNFALAWRERCAFRLCSPQGDTWRTESPQALAFGTLMPEDMLSMGARCRDIYQVSRGLKLK